MRFISIAALALSATVPAQAAWQRASSPHFIIYANESPAELKAFAEKLERFDKAVRVTRAMADPPAGDGNRLTVFVVPGQIDVAKLMRGNDADVAGFYRIHSTGAIAVVPRSMPRFHEYAHHLMFQELSTPYPPWFVEGFAEFMSTADVNADGSVGLGGALTHRARSLYQPTNPLPFTSMLGAEAPRSSEERLALYAHGWLLAHYLTFSPERRGQLETYLTDIAAGRSPLESAKRAFGDVGALERETQIYLKKGKFPYLTIPAARLPIGEVTAQPVSPGMAAIMPLLMRMRSGIDNNDWASLAARMRSAAAPYGADPGVQAALAEAELDAGNAAAAEAAADRAIAANPAEVNAMLVEGRAVMTRAAAAQPGASFVDARNWFSRANKVDPEDPEPLRLYYEAYRVERARPTANAIAALHYAADLAPQDRSLRMNNARQYLVDGMTAKARKALVPLAFDPHGGKLSDDARRMIALIDSGQPKNALAAPATP